VANLGQEDVGELDAGVEADGVGDACDPRPDGAGDRLLLFERFDGALDPDWDPIGPADCIWSVSGGALHETGAATTDECSLLFPLSAVDVVVETRAAYTEFTSTGVRNLWTGARASRGASNLNAYTCSARMPDPSTSTIQAFTLVEGGPNPSISSQPVPAIIEGALHTITTRVVGSRLDCTWDASVSTGGTDTRYTGAGQGVVVGTLRGRARFESLVVWELGP
jgi:hypothetical protein